MPTVAFTLKAYIDRLSATGSDNIPSMSDLARACDMEPTPFSRMINNHTHGLDKRKLAAIISEFRKRNHPTLFNDILSFYE